MIEKKKWEEGKEQRDEEERKQKEFEAQRLKIEIEQREKIKNYYQCLTNENKKCEVCNINHCKCVNPSFLKNEYGIYSCIHCKKRRNKCIKITNYFK